MATQTPPLAADGLPEGMPDAYGIPTLGWGVLAWGEEFLAQPDGTTAGDPWRWTDTQARLVAWWYAVEPDGRWLYRRGQIVLPKGAGKALSLGMRLPTPDGWTTMGDVQVGDQLLDEHGHPCTILATTPVMQDHDCYRVEFSDGTSVVADADHLWPMQEFKGAAKRKDRLLTTREMAATGVKYQRALTRGRTKASTSGVSRWKTAPTPAMDLPEADFKGIPPYLLGYWLGDGDSDVPRITVDVADHPFLLAKAEALGMPLGEPRVTGNPSGNTYRVTFGCGTRGGGNARLAAARARNGLQELGVLKNKHIPEELLRGSYKQRLELLQGLMDSDGSVDRSGRVELSLSHERLASDALELLRSLGLPPRMSRSSSFLNGRRVGTRWRINVTAYRDEDLIFTLPRKVERLRLRGPQEPFSRTRVVTAIVPVPSEPVRCVSVSSESSLYLAGDGMVPTHNSPLAAALCCCELGGEVLFDGFDANGEPVGRPHPSPHVQLAAVSESQTSNTMSLVLSMLREGRAAEEIPGLDIGLTRVRTRNGRLEPVTASATSREGQRLTAAVLDEPHLWLAANGGVRLAATLRRNLGKMAGRSLETTNAWLPGEDSVAESTSLYADAIAERARSDGDSGARVGGLLRYHPQAHVLDLSNRDELFAALSELYVDAPWVDVDRLVSEVYDFGTHPADARRYYLNAVVSADDALVTGEQWAACVTDDVLEPGEEVTLGFDGSKTEDSSVLVAMRVRDRFATVLGAQEHDPKDPGWEVDREYFDGLVASVFAQYRVVGFFSDVAHFETYVDKWSNEYGSELAVKASTKSMVGWDMRGRLQQSTAAVERLVAGVADRSVRHDGGTLLRRHVLNARRRPNRWGVSFGKARKDSPHKVDGFASLLLADMARAEYIAAGSSKRARTGNVW